MCERATYNGPSGGKVWSAIFENFVSEAERRGLDCGVSSNQSNGTNNFETYFKTLVLGKELKFNSLQDLGYYKATVDGLWGKELESRRNSLETTAGNSPNYAVVQSLNKKVKSQASTGASSSNSSEPNKTV